MFIYAFCSIFSKNKNFKKYDRFRIINTITANKKHSQQSLIKMVNFQKLYLLTKIRFLDKYVADNP